MEALELQNSSEEPKIVAAVLAEQTGAELVQVINVISYCLDSLKISRLSFYLSECLGQNRRRG